MQTSKGNETALGAPARVLIIAPSFDILGGQAIQASRLLARLSAEPSLDIGFLPINPRLPGMLRKLQSIKYVRTIVTSIMYCATLLAEVRKYDLIHVFSASYFSFLLAPTPAILVAKLFGKKTLLDYHSGEAADHLQRWHWSAIPTIRLVDEVVVPSQYLVRVFSEFGLRTKPIRNLIETEKFHYRERKSLRAVFLSNRNLETHYGVDRVLRAFAIIQRQLPEARLIVAGYGSRRASLERLALELKLQNTSFTGKIPHHKIADLYDEVDVFLNGSEIDNQPLSILEAFACGLPVVTTNPGGIPDIVSNERTGLVVPCGDYKALADSAIRLMRDSSLAQTIGRNAHHESRKYSWESVRDDWMKLYLGLLSENPRFSSG